MSLESESQELSAFKAELIQARAEILSEIDDINQIDEVEQDLIDSIDNLVEQIDQLERMEDKTADMALLRRERLKFAALLSFFNQVMDELYGEEDDFEESEEEEAGGHDHHSGCSHC